MLNFTFRLDFNEVKKRKTLLENFPSPTTVAIGLAGNNWTVIGKSLSVRSTWCPSNRYLIKLLDLKVRTFRYEYSKPSPDDIKESFHIPLYGWRVASKTGHKRAYMMTKYLSSANNTLENDKP